MLTSICNWFVKITAWPAQKIVFRTKVYYEDKKIQSRNIKGPAIIISNHTSVYDYALWIFVYYSRTLRFQMAEILFEKPLLGIFLKMMGGICVNRNSHDFGFIAKSGDILKKNGVVGIFPEARLPLKGEERPLPFKPSAAYLALMSGVKVIPAYTNGEYFTRKKAEVYIGTPINPLDFVDDNLSEKENIERVNDVFRQKIIELEAKLNEERKQRKK